MINKKIIHFNSKSEFNKKKDTQEILDTSIVFVKDTNTIYTHGEEYQFIEWSYINYEEYVPCLLSDGSM